MKIKGFDALAKHVPEMNTTGGKLKVALCFFGIFILTTIYFILTDQIPTWTLDSQIVVMALGYLLLSRFFTQKKFFIEKYEDSAYRHAFGRHVLPGLAVIFAAVVHIAYMNGPKFTQPMITTIFSVLGWLSLIIGMGLCIRSVMAFGIDNLTMLYVYFPDEGNMVNSRIYGILRHPVYAGVLRVCIGLALLNMGIYPITFVILLPLAVAGWVRLVEEKELIERFSNYAEYRKQVPAFWVSPGNIGRFWKFIVTGK